MVRSDKNPAPRVINCLVENLMSNAHENFDFMMALNNNVYTYEGVHVMFTDFGIVVKGYRTEQELIDLAAAE